MEWSRVSGRVNKYVWKQSRIEKIYLNLGKISCKLEIYDWFSYEGYLASLKNFRKVSASMPCDHGCEDHERDFNFYILLFCLGILDFPPKAAIQGFFGGAFLTTLTLTPSFLS